MSITPLGQEFHFGHDKLYAYDKPVIFNGQGVDAWGIWGKPGIIILPFDNNHVFSVTHERSMHRIAASPHRTLWSAMRFVYELLGIGIDWTVALEEILAGEKREYLKLVISADLTRSLAESGSVEEYVKRQREAGR